MTTTLVFVAKRLIGSLKHVISMESSLMHGLGYISAAALKGAVISFKSGSNIPKKSISQFDDGLPNAYNQYSKKGWTG